MSILDIFRKDDGAVEELTKQLEELRGQVSKVSDLNDSLTGIVGNNMISLTTSKVGKSFETHYTVNRGIDLLADNISGLPLRVFRGEELMPLDYVLPGGFTLQDPNPQMSLNELIYVCSIYYFYRGEFMIYINLENTPMTLEPINPKLMRKTNDGVWKWDNKIIIPDDQLIYTKLFNPDGDRGLSPVDVVKSELLNDSSASEFALKFFENFAQLGGTLQDELGLASKDDMQTMTDQFNTGHAGAGNAYKTLGLPKGIKYTSDMQTMREMDFLSSKRDIRDRILSALGIHKAVFGVTDQVDRAVADAAMRQLWTQTLKPKAVRIQEKITQHLMKRYFRGFRVVFDFSEVEVLQENRESQLNQAKAYRELGYTTNEINELFGLGMEEITDEVGNMRFVPTNLIPTENLLFEPDALAPEPVPKSIDKIVEILEDEEAEAKSVKTVDKARRNYANEHARIQGRTEAQMTKTLRKYFSEQLRDVTKALYSTTKAIDLNTTLSAIHNLIYAQKQKLMDAMRPSYETGGTNADKLALSAISLDIAPAFASEVVESMVAKIANINNHTYKLIRDQVVEGVAAGEAVNTLAKRITSVYKFNASRSRTIARTESANLVNRQTDYRYKAAEVKKKQWLDTPDGNTRETHTSANNEGIVPYDHVFANGLRYPGDPAGSAAEVINCRCTLIPVVT